ncbi:pseudouridine synthase [Kocuria rhizophila]|uniref:pseudouridine synthase n=1 Tax=Kocuria rhizophila TaxID=72000 RepID=UPI003D6E2A95
MASSHGNAPRGGGARGPQGRGKGSKAGPKGGFRSGPGKKGSGDAAGGRGYAKGPGAKGPGAARGKGPAGKGPGKPKAGAAQKGPQKPRAFAGVDKYERRASAIKEHGPHRRRRPKNPPVDRLEVHDENGVRLQKLMAQAGVASRRVCEEMIQDGRVSVDGEVVTELGVRVDPALQAVHVDGMRIQTDEKLVYYAFNKPAGVVSTMEDPDGRRCVSDYLDPRKHQRVFHVGRLDVETEGLLLLTNDGELTNRLTHPSYEVPKTYMVQVHGPVEKGIGNQMKEGIRLEDGVAKVDDFRLVDSTPGHVLIEVVLHSGRNRIVRRMFDAVDHPVEKLARTHVGPIAIGDQKQGTVRKLSHTEVGNLLASVGM